VTTPDRRYYPVMLDLTGRTVLVAGGGEVALRKVEGLVGAGAGCIRVVAPEISDEIVRAPGVECRRQAYDATALEGVALAIAATDSAEVNSRVAADCRPRGILCNVVDVPGECDFIVPSILRQGPLVVAVSTGGASPRAAARIRREIEEHFGPAYGLWLDALGRLRQTVQRQVTDGPTRRRVFARLSEGDVLAAAEEGAAGLARKVNEILDDFGLKEDAP